jgi:methylaspartate mutase epsilon subunit
MMSISNQKIDKGIFLEQRKNVLNMWKTGAEVDIEDAIAYHRNMPKHKNLVHQLRKARDTGTAMMHNLCGVSTMKQQKELLLALQNEGGSGLLHCIYDSMTRTCRFAEAEKMMRESERTGKNMLNGFPVVAYGVKGCRELFETLDRPFSALGPSIDARLATEIALASGFSELVLNTFTAFETYTKTVSLDDIITYHQYAARLVGYYQESGVNLAVIVPNGPGGDNAPGLAPPSLGTVGNILGALLAAAQGAKHLVFDYHSHGNLAQDAASCAVRLKLAKKYLDYFGYKDVELYLENGQMGGQYPQNFDQAFVQVVYGASLSAFFAYRRTALPGQNF